MTPEERQKARSVYTRTLSSKKDMQNAQKAWTDYEHQLIADHVRDKEAGALMVTLQDGRSVTLPGRWANGLAFTPDFRYAVPRSL